MAVIPTHEIQEQGINKGREESSHEEGTHRSAGAGQDRYHRNTDRRRHAEDGERQSEEGTAPTRQTDRDILETLKATLCSTWYEMLFLTRVYGSWSADIPAIIPAKHSADTAINSSSICE